MHDNTITVRYKGDVEGLFEWSHRQSIESILLKNVGHQTQQSYTILQLKLELTENYVIC